MAKAAKIREDIKLAPKDEKKLFSAFSKYAKALTWTGAKTTYYIHVGTRILKSKDTRDLFIQLKEKFVADPKIVIW